MIFILASFLFASVSADNVLQLTKDTYDSTVAEGHILVKYFSPNCPHCVSVASTFVQLSDNFAKHKEKIRFAEVDCTVEKEICDKVDVRGYPTINFYGKDEKDVKEYEGDRSLENFSEFIAKETGIFYKPKPSKLKVLTPDNFESIAMDPKLNVLVAFTAPWCGHCKNLKPQFESAANSFKDTDNVVLATMNAEEYSDFTEPYEIRGFPTIKYFPAYRPGDVEKAAEMKEAAAKKKEERKTKLDAFAASRAEEHKKLIEDAKKEWEDGKAKAEAEKKEGEEETPYPEFVEPAAPVKSEEEKKLWEEEEDEKYLPAKKGANELVSFSGPRDAASIVDWINKHAGTWRALGGGIAFDCGMERKIVEKLTEFVHAVTNTPMPSQNPEDYPAPDENATEPVEPVTKTVPPPPLEETRTELNSQIDQFVVSPLVAATYRRYMADLEKKGLDWIRKEETRLTNLLSTGRFTDEKRAEITIRKNALSYFFTI